MQGRPTELTPEIQAQIAADIADGNTIECAAGCAGVDERTVYRWLEWGRDGREPYAAFCQAITRARAEAEKLFVKSMRTAASSAVGEVDHRAASWWLSHARPDQWADTRRVEVKVAEETQKLLDVARKSLPHDAFKQLLTALAAGEGGAPDAGDNDGDGAGEG